MVYYLHIVLYNEQQVKKGGENMARIDVSDPKTLKAAVEKYLGDYQGPAVCALQLWYQGLGGQGVPNPAEMAAIENAIAGTSGWESIGDIRDERFGVQKTFKCTIDRKREMGAKKIMVQHIYKKEGFYKEPDGTVLRVATSEAWNLRCFEVKNGKQIGPMIKIHPESDRAKALVEVSP